MSLGKHQSVTNQLYMRDDDVIIEIHIPIIHVIFFYRPMDIDKENFEQLSISKELLIKGMSTYFTSGMM